MAIVALSNSDTSEYVLLADPDRKVTKKPLDPADPTKGEEEVVEIGDGATKFKLRPLDVFLMAHIYDNATQLRGREGDQEVGINTRINQTNIQAVRFGLAGFSNFRDRNGKVINHETVKEVINRREYSVVTDRVMETLGLPQIAELATEIKRISEVSTDTAKKSVGASSLLG